MGSYALYVTKNPRYSSRNMETVLSVHALVRVIKAIRRSTRGLNEKWQYQLNVKVPTAGGLDDISYVTRFIPATSFVILDDIRFRTSGGNTYLRHHTSDRGTRREQPNPRLQDEKDYEDLPISSHEILGLHRTQRYDLMTHVSLKMLSTLFGVRIRNRTCSYVLISPITPTAFTGSRTANACAI